MNPKVHHRTLLAAILLGVLPIVPGCSSKVETNELQTSFEKASKESGEKGEPQQKPDASVQTALNDVVQSIKKDDLPAAVEPLYVLRAQPNLTVDQRIAVQDMMGKVQTRLAERADKGDKAAQAALQRYRQIKTR